MAFEPVVIELTHPVQHGNETVNKITIGREMVAGDLRGISVAQLTHDNICEITSRLSGLPPSVIFSLKMPDYLNVSEVISGFFDASPRLEGSPNLSGVDVSLGTE